MACHHKKGKKSSPSLLIWAWAKKYLRLSVIWPRIEATNPDARGCLWVLMWNYSHVLKASNKDEIFVLFKMFSSVIETQPHVLEYQLVDYDLLILPLL